MKVYLVVSVGVYDHGVWFVGQTYEKALAWALSHSPDGDGYHDWRIEEHAVGEESDVMVYPPHPKTRITDAQGNVIDKEVIP